MVEAYEVLSNPERRELYDRFGHAGLRSGGFEPTSFDFGTLGDLFSAFFGDDLFGVGGRTRGAARGADVAAEVEIELVEAARGVTRDVSLRVAVACDDLRRQRRRARHAARHLPDVCGGAGRVQQVSQHASSASSSARRPARAAAAPAASSSTRAQACDGEGRVARGAHARRRDPAGDPRRPADPARAARATPARSAGRAGDVYVLVRVAPDPRFVREGNDI